MDATRSSRSNSNTHGSTRYHNQSQPTGPVTDQQRVKQQFQLFQDALPKVNSLSFRALINEIVPLAMSMEKIKDNSDTNELVEQEADTNESVKKDSDSKDSIEQEVDEVSKQLDTRLTLNTGKGEASDKLIRELCDSEEDVHERVMNRVRSMGLQIGCNLTELLVFSNNPNLHFRDMDILLIMKFICRDVWKQLFEKQIDNLKTNHRGTFYLLDYNYIPIQEFAIDEDESLDASANEERLLALVAPFLEIPAGIIKGVLVSFGYQSEEISCSASFIDRPTGDKTVGVFPKGVSFHVQVTASNP
ncbi:hypothetical protein TBLA_0C05570 [Henningerozyma blattae CBS 6284]|uniref:Trafficking protein particle complex subunit n=1 Tax=Henningerozyma blattae (strain ATCC 34711 / CBS 6284 / DSM 70876 / NBRC 10599 / NRRL Y-10934 / UCD 77-7) TaxID=1071380 RepID=I2H1V3_HENB6|nr:hypothetical protein TBLA_0C05570 [Tetrapisispora blattae CBS 6284]CCH60355.1 hypothetical protein TBLA_0C05570 [Tetrapisispora blattae CBS 6284]